MTDIAISAVLADIIGRYWYIDHKDVGGKGLWID